MTHHDLPLLPVLEAHSLVKTFGNLVALDHVDFAVYPGEVLAVVGDNGAGKSTLVRCLSAADLPDSGVIRLDGADVRFRTAREARMAGVNAVFQSVDADAAIDISTNLYRDREKAHPGPLGKALLWMEEQGHAQIRCRVAEQGGPPRRADSRARCSRIAERAEVHRAPSRSRPADRGRLTQHRPSAGDGRSHPRATAWAHTSRW